MEARLGWEMAGSSQPTRLGSSCILNVRCLCTFVITEFSPLGLPSSRLWPLRSHLGLSSLSLCSHFCGLLSSPPWAFPAHVCVLTYMASELSLGIVKLTSVSCLLWPLSSSPLTLSSSIRWPLSSHLALSSSLLCPHFCDLWVLPWDSSSRLCPYLALPWHFRAYAFICALPWDFQAHFCVLRTPSCPAFCGLDGCALLGPLHLRLLASELQVEASGLDPRTSVDFLFELCSVTWKYYALLHPYQIKKIINYKQINSIIFKHIFCVKFNEILSV